MIMSIVLFCSLMIIIKSNFWCFSNAAPSIESKSWPLMKNYDIWGGPKETQSNQIINYDKILKNNDYNENKLNQVNNNINETLKNRESKVLNFFPIPVDDECLSDDGRRSGICLNVYECRIQGGTSRGQCALGFGVCCVFKVTCDQEVGNNITYFESPSFPGFMRNNMTTCRLKIKMISEDISQLRIDFNHFSLGQPNRTTGVCDGDTFSLSGGLDGVFTLCGQNSGQHVYYNVGSMKSSRQSTSGQNGNLVGSITPSPPTMNFDNPLNMNVTGNSSLNNDDTGGGSSNASSDDGGNIIEILMNFTSRIFPTRLWEIRITQIPFSQRAPAGCLQYFTGLQGVIQTFNFADNGRHLANQNYRSCVRQEMAMCSIAYEPCDGQSFRIGSTNNNNNMNDGNVDGANPSGGGGGGTLPNINGLDQPTLSDSPSMDPAGNQPTNPLTDSPAVSTEPSVPLMAISEVPTSVEPSTTPVPTQPPEDTQPSTQTEPIQADDPDAVEGSGGGDIPTPVVTPPVRGGFDIFSLFRNTIFDFSRRRGRQYFSQCTDRITMPCVVEDFIGAGAETLPGCEPIHCGNNFCSSNSESCRIESTVTPFGIGVHFGDGIGKGSPEENIGACLKYSQMPCV